MYQAMANTYKLHEAHAPRESKHSSTRNGLFCALAMAAAVLISNPSANMPFIDDFSYIKSAIDFAHTGRFVYNGWAVEILGWLIPWGALFIKIFGFSFTGMRFSMLPLAMLAVFLFHQILRRFGVNAPNSVFGALTLGISPLFLPMATSFMTDVPGLLVILVCIYMCQRAVAATSDHSALLWLCAATLVNVAGGTVRQIAWLGALVMVPSTAWLLRRRRGMKVATVLLFLFAFAGVEACMRCFAHQPYSVPEHIIQGAIHPMLFVHLGAQMFKTLLCLLLVVLPVSVAWLSTGRLSRNARLRIAGAMILLLFIAIGLYVQGGLDGWSMPWLTPVIAAQTSWMPGFFGMTSSTVTLWTRVAVSLLVIAPAVVLVEKVAAHNLNQVHSKGWKAASWSWKEMGWILGPFCFSYFLLLMPRGTFYLIQDRYVLGLVPVAIIALLRLYQELAAPKVPSLSLVTFLVFAAYSIAGTHNFFAWSRATVKTIQILHDSGVPRISIQAGLASDGWAQIQHGGHINDPRIQFPKDAYTYIKEDTNLPADGCSDWFAPYTPAIVARYYVVSGGMTCAAPTKFRRVRYTSWLPPFHRALEVRQWKSSVN